MISTEGVSALNSPSSPGHARDLPGLDGLRAVAVLMVILYHSTEDLAPGNPLRSIAKVGSFGVQIFFVLSGFLITHLLLHEEEQHGWIDLGKFYVRRALRILPPLYFLVAVLIAMNWLGWPVMPPQLIASCLLFYRNFVQGPWVSNHLWTLAVEEHFYLIWPLVFVACRTSKTRLWVVSLVVIFAPIWRRFVIWQVGSLTAVNWFRTDLRYDGILIGCLLALLTNVGTAERLLNSRAMRHGFTSCLAIAMLAATIPLGAWIAPTIRCLWVAILMNQVVRSRDGLLTRFLSLTAIAWIGRLSYSIYLWQQLFMDQSWPGSRSWACHLPWNIAAIATASIFSYYVVEKPFFRLRARFRRESESGNGIRPDGWGGRGLRTVDTRSAGPAISTPSQSR